MGHIAEVLSSQASEDDGVPLVEVRVDVGGTRIRTTQHFAAAGDDARPLPGDFAALQPSTGSGVEDAIGYHDPRNETKAQPGEKRIYARDQDGNPVCEIWLKGDGTLVIDADGSVEVNAPRVSINSPDVRLGSSPGRQVACVGDIVSGSVRALSTAPGVPILPAAGLPTPTGGVPFVAQIVSGRPSVKA